MSRNKTKNRIITLVGLVLIIILISAVIIFGQPKTQTPAASNLPVNNLPAASTNSSGNVQTDQFRAEVPKNTTIPEVGQPLTDAEKNVIAVPSVVVPAAPGVTSKFRRFGITGSNNQFTPYKIIGRLGDTMHIDFTAADKDYDLVFPGYNMKGIVLKGQTKAIEFQANKDGDFIFYCDLSCGGEAGTAKGHIIISP